MQAYIIVVEGGVAVLGSVSPSEVIWEDKGATVTVLNGGQGKRLTLPCSSLTGQGSEFYTTSDEVTEGDPSACAEAFYDDVHGLRAQIVTCT